MDIDYLKLLKSMAKKSPKLVAALGLFFSITKYILDSAGSEWLSEIGYLLILSMTFALSFTIVLINELKDILKNKTRIDKKTLSETDIKINDIELSDIDTKSGDLILGCKNGTADKKSQIDITEVKIEKVRTGGGDFVVGMTSTEAKDGE